MQAYNKEILNNEVLAAQAKELYKMKFIPKEQFKEITSRLTLFNSSSNLLVRIGFFLLGCLLLSAISGFLALFFGSILDRNFEVLVFVYGIIGVIGAEFLARNGYFGHGLDDAFVLSIPLYFCIGTGITTESMSMVFAVMTLLGFVCCLRYVHTLSVLVGGVGFVGFVFDLIVNHALMDKLFLPFVGFFMGGGLYFISKNLKKKGRFYIYSNALWVAKGFALLLMYFSVNYMVVREFSEDLMNLVVTPGNDIPLAFVFYTLTFLLPLFYIGYALKTKDRLMLLLGLFTLGYSIFTIRFYYHLMPLEIALILGGILLFGISYLAIQKLKDARQGITFQPDRSNESSFLLTAQALIVTTQIQTKIVTSEDKMPFGGGGFSGGGSGGGY
ncbi:hypothetical protein LZZ90_02785 [Flavobacterium sp. SM15]|uniref:hypothetical protein n=1 Tax=Flavobacterium sp. SM15 TaxID=2908005 RepID=UPI001EDA0354|nr:hypothetical protein [Flavobacterium sp. SM15]MCG2610432.1 hypothetical protein [Flavobacterium sp. SM15]